MTGIADMQTAINRVWIKACSLRVWGGIDGFPITNVGNDGGGTCGGDRGRPRETRPYAPGDGGGLVGVIEAGRVRRGPTHRGLAGMTF